MPPACHWRDSLFHGDDAPFGLVSALARERAVTGRERCHCPITRPALNKERQGKKASDGEAIKSALVAVGEIGERQQRRTNNADVKGSPGPTDRGKAPVAEPSTSNMCKALLSPARGPWRALSQNGITDAMQLWHMSCHTLTALLVALLPLKVSSLCRIVQRDTKPVSQTGHEAWADVQDVS